MMQRITQEMRNRVRAVIGPERYDSTAGELERFSRDSKNRRRRELYQERQDRWRSNPSK